MLALDYIGLKNNKAELTDSVLVFFFPVADLITLQA